MELVKQDFHHPYKPYDIQYQLMKVIYECIAEEKIGIFESPTGTGKSLSLICSSLTWLRDFQEKALQSQETLEHEKDEPDWVVEYSRSLSRKAVIERKSELEARLRQIRAKELRQRQSYGNGEHRAKRIKASELAVAYNVEDETRFELEEYASDEEASRAQSSSKISPSQGLSSASLQLMEKLGLVSKPAENEDTTPTDDLKIYFCSRTHSQLTQFVQEIRRVDLPAASWVGDTDLPGTKEPAYKPVVKHLPLGSRKNMCINPKVSRLGNGPAINERCLELQQPDIPKDRKCPFIPTNENQTLVNEFRDHTLAKIRDIEDLGFLGTKVGICPYYASRKSIKPSEIVTLPYPMLLQKAAREALDISLKGHVVIIDEAHNLMDTISNIHSIRVTQGQLRRCRAQLGIYLQKFRNKLKGKNRVYVAQLVRLIDSMSGYLQKKVEENRSSEDVVNINDLMAGKGVDQMNLYKLVNYLQESKLARKVEGYSYHAREQESKTNPSIDLKATTSTRPVLSHVQSFLQTLTNPVAEGRFFCEKDDNDDLALKYMLLDPTHHFKEIVQDARAIILVGGTMSPMEDYIHHLFAYTDRARIMTFSCGHIIPKENLIAMPVIQGPGGIDFDFTYEKRNSPTTIEALGNCLVDLSDAIPDGMVVFFPSYAYLDQVVLRWQTKISRVTQTIYSRLSEKKPIFRESRTTSGVDDILMSYSHAVSTGGGALLLSVIGGKLSEGINFSDALGRGVIVVGLPFPNIHSAQWKAKLDYIEQTTAKRTGSREEGKAASKDFYENACMRAVNQCIGRAIRHQGDYASILLVDRRYRTPRIEGKLPGWIQQGIVKGDAEGFTGVVGHLKRFFESKKVV